MARATGRFTGLAAGMLYRARRQFFKFAEETEISKVNCEARLPSVPLRHETGSPAKHAALLGR